tara:strand:+ start:426 stop:785 length:360 start_codon:yes stop_codon:yes gene_type:complete
MASPFDTAWSLLKQYGAARAMGWDIPTNNWMTQMQNRQVAQQQVQQPTATNTMGASGQTQQDAQAFGQHLAGTTVGNVAQGGTMAPPSLTHMAQAPNVFQQPSQQMGTTLSAPSQVRGY